MASRCGARTNFHCGVMPSPGPASSSDDSSALDAVAVGRDGAAGDSLLASGPPEPNESARTNEVPARRQRKVKNKKIYERKRSDERTVMYLLIQHSRPPAPAIRVNMAHVSAMHIHSASRSREHLVPIWKLAAISPRFPPAALPPSVAHPRFHDLYFLRLSTGTPPAGALSRYCVRCGELRIPGIITPADGDGSRPPPG